MVSVDEKNDMMNELRKHTMGEIRIVPSEPKAHAKYVEVAKAVIDWGYDRAEGFEITFSEDYKRIKKTKYVKP